MDEVLRTFCEIFIKKMEEVEKSLSESKSKKRTDVNRVKIITKIMNIPKLIWSHVLSLTEINNLTKKNLPSFVNRASDTFLQIVKQYPIVSETYNALAVKFNNYGFINLLSIIFLTTNKFKLYNNEFYESNTKLFKTIGDLKKSCSVKKN
jgi:hypothetical protein